jgi:hypothetical protein
VRGTWRGGTFTRDPVLGNMEGRSFPKTLGEARNVFILGELLLRFSRET